MFTVVEHSLPFPQQHVIYQYICMENYINDLKWHFNLLFFRLNRNETKMSALFPLTLQSCVLLELTNMKYQLDFFSSLRNKVLNDVYKYRLFIFLYEMVDKKQKCISSYFDKIFNYCLRSVIVGAVKTCIKRSHSEQRKVVL